MMKLSPDSTGSCCVWNPRGKICYRFSWASRHKQRHGVLVSEKWLSSATCMLCSLMSAEIVNTLRPRQNGRHFPDDIFKWIFLNEDVWISIKFLLKFVPRGPMNNIPSLVQAMAWRRLGDKPLSEPMMVRLPMHICVTRPQWVNT